MDDECADCGAELDSYSEPVTRWVCGSCWEQLPGSGQPFSTLVYEGQQRL